VCACPNNASAVYLATSNATTPNTTVGQFTFSCTDPSLICVCKKTVAGLKCLKPKPAGCSLTINLYPIANAKGKVKVYAALTNCSDPKCGFGKKKCKKQLKDGAYKKFGRSYIKVSHVGCCGCKSLKKVKSVKKCA
jgi:hypothetical protein